MDLTFAELDEYSFDDSGFDESYYNNNDFKNEIINYQIQQHYAQYKQDNILIIKQTLKSKILQTLQSFRR